MLANAKEATDQTQSVVLKAADSESKAENDNECSEREQQRKKQQQNTMICFSKADLPSGKNRTTPPRRHPFRPSVSSMVLLGGTPGPNGPTVVAGPAATAHQKQSGIFGHANGLALKPHPMQKNAPNNARRSSPWFRRRRHQTTRKMILRHRPRRPN